MVEVSPQKFAVEGNYCKFPLASVDDATLRKIRSDLTVENKLFTGRVITKELFHVKDELMYVPRAYMLNTFRIDVNETHIHMCEGEDIPAEALADKKFTLKDYQVKFGGECIKTHLSAEKIKTGSAGCVCVLPTGTGKTFLGMQFIRYFKKVTLFLTNTDVSVRKITKLLREMNPGMTIATFDDIGTEAFEHFHVFVATVHRFVLNHALLQRDTELANKFKHRVGLTLYDEIHTLGGPEFSKIFDMFSPYLQIGLSATPLRRDHNDTIYLSKIGPTFDMNDWRTRYMLAHPGASIPVFETPRYPTNVLAIHYANKKDDKYTKWVKRNKKDIDVASTIRNITSDPDRRPVLRRVIRDLLLRSKDTTSIEHPVCMGRGASIIIFCNYIDEIDNLVHYLESIDFIQNPTLLNPSQGHAGEAGPATDDASVAQPIRIHKVVGKSSPLAVNDAISNARIIVTNYVKLGTAFSEERFIYGILWSTAKTVVEQAVGRIGRYCDYYTDWNSRERVLIDIIDGGGSLSMIQYMHHRKELYEKLGFKLRNLYWDIEKQDYI